MLSRFPCPSVSGSSTAQCGALRALAVSSLSKHLMSTTSSGSCLCLKYHRCAGFGLTVHVSCRLPDVATRMDAGTRSESATVVASARASGEVRTVARGRQIWGVVILFCQRKAEGVEDRTDKTPNLH